MSNANFCMHCGAELPQGAAFCPSCGGNLKSGDPGDSLNEEDMGREYEESEDNGIDESVNAAGHQESGRDVLLVSDIRRLYQEDELRRRELRGKRIRHILILVVIGAIIGFVIGAIEHVVKKKNAEKSDISLRGAETGSNIENTTNIENTKSHISLIRAAATGSAQAKAELFNAMTNFYIVKRDGAIDDGKTEKALVSLCVNGVIDDKIKAYKKIHRESGEKFISLDDLDVPAPPLSISMRTGLLSSYVIEVRNESEKTQHIRIFIYNHSSYDSIFGSKIKPGETENFGYYEFENNWRPEPGDMGFIRVSGYNELLTFKLLPDGRYSTSHSYFVPPDCPLELKKDFIRSAY